MKRLLLAAPFLLCMTMVLPTPVSGQDDGPRSETQLAVDLERSEALYSQAFDREIDRGDWRGAARLYVESASLRPYGDMKAYLALDRAGKLYSHSGRMRDAHRAFASAGVRALETGRIYEAAMAFANAAETSQSDTRDIPLGPDYLRMVHRLVESPSLTADQRSIIRERAGLGGI